MRPFFPYYGSKWNIARHYPKPMHDLVVEPFAGAAGYATYYNCPRVRLYDADPIIYWVWHYLMTASPEEVMALPELPEVGDHVDNYDLPQEAKWLIGFWLNRGSAQPKKSRTAYSARTDRAQLNWGAKAKERIAAQMPMIKGWTVFNESYENALGEEATWFIDPPYGDKGKHLPRRVYRFCQPRGLRAVAAWAGDRVRGARSRLAPVPASWVFQEQQGPRRRARLRCGGSMTTLPTSISSLLARVEKASGVSASRSSEVENG